jgi:ribosomal-protein-alanine N-acetyltransferase
MSAPQTKQRPQSFTVVWEFRVKAGKQRAFEKAYGAGGDWVQLFRHSEDYIGTELIRDRDRRLRYVTLDHWNSREAYLRFKKENREAYQTIDAKCEALTTREKLIGEFDGFKSKENNGCLADTALDTLTTCPELAEAAPPGSPSRPAGARIRPATLADLSGIIALERDSHSAAHWPEPTYRRMFAADSALRIVLVVEDHDAAVRGFAIARVVGEEGEIENIVVDHKRQNQGWGTGLLLRMIERARSRNVSRLFLEVRESNPAARALYEKCGFALSGRRRAYYTRPSEDAVVYTCKL